MPGRTIGPAPANPAATTVSKPPVASIATNIGHRAFNLSISSSIPAPLRPTAKLSPPGLTATSSRSFDTSMPT
ncbi:hypothetical protein V1281_003281 [Nitrobacteraceae bacterium AZCC 2161]